jgi:fructose-specific phosphotransferase system IIC component
MHSLAIAVGGIRLASLRFYTVADEFGRLRAESGKQTMRSKTMAGFVGGLIAGLVFGVMMQMMKTPEGMPMAMVLLRHESPGVVREA